MGWRDGVQLTLPLVMLNICSSSSLQYYTRFKTDISWGRGLFWGDLQLFCPGFNCCLVLKVQYMHPYLILNGGFSNCVVLPCFHQRAKRLGHKMAGFWKPFSSFWFLFRGETNQVFIVCWCFKFKYKWSLRNRTFRCSFVSCCSSIVHWKKYGQSHGLCDNLRGSRISIACLCTHHTNNAIGNTTIAVHLCSLWSCLLWVEFAN